MSVKHTTGFNYSALHLYSDPAFAPLRLVTNQMWEFDWRRNGLPILILPFAFLGIHDTYISDRLAQLHSELGQIESALLAPYRPDIEGLDFGQLTRRLHEFSTALSNLARRAHFQDTVLNTVEEALCTLNGRVGWSLEIQRARLDGLKKAMQGRRYDLEMMPKRELTARATVRISLLTLGQNARIVPFLTAWCLDLQSRRSTRSRHFARNWSGEPRNGEECPTDCPGDHA
jgi:hypothetical protein